MKAHIPRGGQNRYERCDVARPRQSRWQGSVVRDLHAMQSVPIVGGLQLQIAHEAFPIKPPIINIVVRLHQIGLFLPLPL